MINIKQNDSVEQFLNELRLFDVSENPFLSFAFLNIYLKYNIEKYYFYYIYNDEKIIGIAPFECTFDSSLLGIKKLRFIGYRKLNYCGYICLENDCEEVHHSMMEYFSNLSQIIIFNYYDINDSSPLYEILIKDKNCFSKNKLYVCPCLRFTDNFDDFFKEVFKSSKKRTELKKFQKRLSDIGNFKIININDINDLKKNRYLIEQIYKIHSERFANVYATSFFGSESMRPYYSELIESLMIDKKAYISLLVMDEIVIAFIFCLTNGKELIDWIPAFDPAFSKYNLGTVQYKMLFEEMCKPDSTYTLFDYSKGSSVYKRKWAKEETANHQFLLKSKRGGMIASIICWIDKQKFSLKCTLRNYGLLSKIKDLIGRVRLILSNKNSSELSEVKYVNAEDYCDINYKFNYSTIRNLPVNVREEVLTGIYSGAQVLKVEKKSEYTIILMGNKESNNINETNK